MRVSPFMIRLSKSRDPLMSATLRLLEHRPTLNKSAITTSHWDAILRGFIRRSHTITMLRRSSKMGYSNSRETKEAKIRKLRTKSFACRFSTAKIASWMTESTPSLKLLIKRSLLLRRQTPSLIPPWEMATMLNRQLQPSTTKSKNSPVLMLRLSNYRRDSSDKRIARLSITRIWTRA